MPAIYINAEDENGNEITEHQDMENCFIHFATRGDRHLDLNKNPEGDYEDPRTVLAWDAFCEGWFACQGA